MDDAFRFRSARLHDRLPAKTAALRRRRGSKSRTDKKAGPPEAKGRRVRYRVLVEKDGLYFLVVGRAVRSDVFDPEADDRAEQTESLADSFRAAFNDVWQRIPEPDRVTLLTRCRGRRPWRQSDDPNPAPTHNPSIRVVDLGAETATFLLCARHGHEMNFPVAQTEEYTWLSVIPQALAEAYRYATGEHGRLMWTEFDEPMVRWEREQGESLDDVIQEVKAAEVEQAFLRVHRREVARLLARWGFDAARQAD